eukprot:2776092-Rhodomonas_salina.2
MGRQEFLDKEHTSRSHLTRFSPTLPLPQVASRTTLIGNRPGTIAVYVPLWRIIFEPGGGLVGGVKVLVGRPGEGVKLVLRRRNVCAQQRHTLAQYRTSRSKRVAL